MGLRAGARPAGRPLPGLRRRPPRSGTIVANAGPLHARPHRQRPGPVHRRRHRTSDDRRRPLVRRRDLRVALGLRQARPGRRRVLRGPAALLVRSAPRRRSEHPPGDRPDLRRHGEVPRRPVVDRRLGRDGRRAPHRAPRVDDDARRRVRDGRRRTAADAQGVRPGMGPGVLDRNVLRLLRPRADARSRSRSRCSSPTTSARSTSRPAR